jgi:hypothetical protein
MDGNKNEEKDRPDDHGHNESKYDIKDRETLAK